MFTSTPLVGSKPAQLTLSERHRNLFRRLMIIEYTPHQVKYISYHSSIILPFPSDFHVLKRKLQQNKKISTYIFIILTK